MKRPALLSALAALALALGTTVAQGQIPNVRIENARGETISTATLGAKKLPMIVSFWSITCKPCIVELNAMNDLLDEWREQAQFEIVVVSTDDVRSTAVARAMADSNGWDRFTLLYDKNQEMKRALNVNLIPHTFIFDSSGKIVYSHAGYTPGTETEYIEIIKNLK